MDRLALVAPGTARASLYKRIAIAFALLALFATAWIVLRRVEIDVVGQPSATGPIQSQFERPFFEGLAEATGLPINIRYKSIDQTGFKDTYQLTMLRDGQLDLVSLRFLQNAGHEPTLLGIDPWGLAPDFQAARAVAASYAPVLDRRLQAHFNAKLLGVWPFGPQVFFCNSRIQKLADIRGLRVRVGHESFGPLIASFGATPAVIPFDDVKAALETGMVDCAITSAGSGRSAGWAKHSTHLFTLGLQMGLNGYVINLQLWKSLRKREQELIEASVLQHVEAIWSHVRRVHSEAISCTTGGECTEGTRGTLVKVEPSPGDIKALREAFERTTFRDWKLRCDSVYPGCTEEWRTRVEPLVAGQKNIQ